ncbi:MAG: tetratricopeptide repeat protein [Caulobacterales bacterium]|uniref:tetratricopeptide repeat protein n=1 Tax=Glycocaulis sp. TaxID=1969725 RepID=UPI003FA0CBD4
MKTIFTSLTALSLAWATAPAHAQIADRDAALAPAGETLRNGQTLIGTPLSEPGFSDAYRRELEIDLAIARAALDLAPHREDSWIWLGRRLGYLGRFEEAVEVFTQGLERFPDSYKLRRFRGRHLARSRQFEAALADYTRALELMDSIEDSFEPDGIANAYNLPLGTFRFNLHYYRGQTSFAVGDFESLVAGMEAARNQPLLMDPTGDMGVAIAYWLFIGHSLLGDEEAARDALSAIHAGLPLIENRNYLRGALFFKGEISREEMDAFPGAIEQFAIAMADRLAGDNDAAEARLEAIVRAGASGFWPAETEILRIRAER